MKQPQTKPVSDRYCETCEFAGRHPDNDGLRFCRKRPPTVVANHQTVWPIVKQQDWCGDYREERA